ncbi:MAG: ABC transporter permease subunit [Dehalococcoidia bacterium]|nr:ABC transporter permease subunit [Dehalococcoidia bacterium]
MGDPARDHGPRCVLCRWQCAGVKWRRLLLSNGALSVWSVLVVLVLWEIAGHLEVSFMLPPLSDVISAMVDVWGRSDVQQSVLDTARSLAIGFTMAITGGIAVGLLMGRFRVAEWAFDMYVNLFLSLPLIALIPIFLLLFGFGERAVIAIVVVYTFFVVVVNTFTGVRSVDNSLVEMAESFGAREHQLVRRVVLPAALPLMLTGVRIGVGRSIKGIIIAEQVVGLVGIGGLIQRYGGAFQIEELYAIIIPIGLFGLLAMESVRVMEWYALPWIRHREVSAAAE